MTKSTLLWGDEKAAFMAGRQCGKTGLLMVEMEDEFGKVIRFRSHHQPDPNLQATAMPDIHGFIQATENSSRLEAREKEYGTFRFLLNYIERFGEVGKFNIGGAHVWSVFKKEMKTSIALSKRFPRHEILAALPVTL